MTTHLLAIRIVSACWIIFGVVWLALAQTTKRSVYRESSKERMRYWLLLVFAYFLLTRGHRFSHPLDAHLDSNNATLAWLGAALCSVGLAFALWARATLGRNWSGTVTFKEEHELIRTGPYRLVRHPIYTGLLTMFVGTSIVIGYIGGFIGALLVFASFWIKLRQEERLMLQHFPHQYPDYRQRTKCIIPFVL